MCAGACDSVAAVLVAVNENVTQIVVHAELQETITGACDCPSILFVVIHDQSVILGTVSESTVVVGSTTGTVLDTQNVIVVVHHLMQQCSADFFNGTG